MKTKKIFLHVIRFSFLSVIFFSIQTDVLSQIIIVNAGNDDTICSGNGIYLGGLPTASGGASPYSYSWNPTGSLYDSTIANPLAAPLNTTTYCVTVTDALGSTATDCVTITVIPSPTADAGINQTVTGGSCVYIGGSPTASGGNPPYTYWWSPSIGLSNFDGPNPAAGPPTTTTYCLTVTDASGCTAGDCITITIVPLSVNAIANPDTVCQGGCTNLSCTSNGTPPYNYSWNCGLNTYVCPSTTTTYSVTVSDSNGATGSDNIVVTVVTCTGIEDNIKLPNIQIIQNPSNDKITIIIKDNLIFNDALIAIFDINGQLILQQLLLREKTDIDINGLAKGFYILKIGYNGQTMTKKIIKE
jgi:hypothetical protein